MYIYFFSLPAWSLKMVGRFLGIRFSVSGKENIIENSACVVLINHQSIVDLLGKTFVN